MNKNTRTMEPIRIKSNAIKSDGVNTIFTDNLEVTFQNDDDKKNFQAMILELGIESDPQMQLYLLESMCYAGVSYEVS